MKDACNSCKHNEWSLDTVLYCIDCKRAYREDTEENKMFKDRYESEIKIKGEKQL